jgi:hypothetical protein
VIFLLGLGGVIGIRRRDWTARRAWDVRRLRLHWQVRGTSMLPWITAVALLVTPIAVADFDYRYLIRRSRSPAPPPAWPSPRRPAGPPGWTRRRSSGRFRRRSRAGNPRSRRPVPSPGNAARVTDSTSSSPRPPRPGRW